MLKLPEPARTCQNPLETGILQFGLELLLNAV